MKKFHWVLLIVAALGIACADSHSNMGPASCFEKAYNLALKGQYDDTAEYFSDEVLNYLKLNKDVTLQKLWGDRLNDGTVKGVKIIERHINGTTCDIQFMMIKSDGTMDQGEDTMVQEKGEWKFDKVKRVR